MPWKVVIAHAEGEEEVAEQLAAPLRAAGYEVAHRGTVLVGEGFNEEFSKALAKGGPVVLCATVRACGTSWAHFICNNAQRIHHNIRVFPVRVEKDAYVKQLALDSKIAEYHSNPEQAIKQLIESLTQYYPIDKSEGPEQSGSGEDIRYLDQVTNISHFDREGLARFRDELRDTIRVRFPQELHDEDFLREAHLMRGGCLTKAGMLLFGQDLFKEFETSIVNCVAYSGTEKSCKSEHKKIEGNVVSQISKIRDFVADKIKKWETRTADDPQAKTEYSYPMVCMEEVIANALVHRDYANENERKVHVNVFSDRIEVVSPGKWQARELEDDSPIQLSELVCKSSVTVNARLAEV